MMDLKSYFTAERRKGEDYDVHILNDKPIFIVYYDCKYLNRAPFYAVYKVIEPLKKGRKVWAHNNIGISPEGGFKSLDEAMRFAISDKG